MRYFTGLLFLGMGEASGRLVELLHHRLDDAVSRSGGLQQSSQGEPEDETEIARERQELEDAVRDLAAALLGREITIGKELPYPPDDGQRQREFWEAIEAKKKRRGSSV